METNNSSAQPSENRRNGLRHTGIVGDEIASTSGEPKSATKTPVGDALGDQAASIATLHKVVETLGQRLGPALSEEPQQEEEVSGINALSELEAAIRTRTEKIDSATRLLNSYIKRITL